MDQVGEDIGHAATLDCDKTARATASLFVKDALAVESYRVTGAVRTRVRTKRGDSQRGSANGSGGVRSPYGEPYCLTSPS